ncbi:hypothetical protein ACFXKC_32900 [Streptomyces sp. NPDC059340]|uniref:hypothetical protein n=1 Tax=Streptomyces sp. NPDC059340 TaxID=3346806 RepID=UPI0036C39001
MKPARLVDDLMEISRFDAGAAAPQLDDIDLAESLRRTLAARAWLDTVDTLTGTARAQLICSSETCPSITGAD